MTAHPIRLHIVAMHVSDAVDLLRKAQRTAANHQAPAAIADDIAALLEDADALARRIEAAGEVAARSEA